MTLVVVTLALIAIRYSLGKSRSSPTKNFRVHSIMLTLTIVGILIVVMAVADAFEIGKETTQVIGAIIIGTLGVSSTTILGNALAGMQMRVAAAFNAGDFLRVGEHFGRVTERGLFHTEIQTEDRDLTTLPNLFLVSNPYRVMRASGTIISATVSLGYDTPRGRIEECLLQAARSVGLEEPFVQVADLGDFSVTSRIAGLFTEVKQTVTCRSNLRKHVMDAPHRVGIEIVSPTFMSTRALDPHSYIRPTRVQPVREKGARPPEAIMFDKAEEAESLENIRDQNTLEDLIENDGKD